jgi:cbb3-type cytochrome oxidase subunit 3
MFKDVLSHMDLSALSTAGLVLFFIVFVAVAFYAFTRPPSQAEQWARIPLGREGNPAVGHGDEDEVEL